MTLTPDPPKEQVLGTEEDLKRFLGQVPLVTASLRVTARCNATCGYCYSRAGTPLAGELPLARWLQIVDEARSLGLLRLFLSGGEPTLVDGIDALVERAARSGVEVVMATNGSTLDLAGLHRLSAAGLALLQLSVDGPMHLHDTLKGLPGLHAHCLKLLGAWSRCANPSGLRVAVSTVVTRGNWDLLTELYQELRRAGCCRWILIPLSPVGRADEAVLPRAAELLEGITSVCDLASATGEVEIVPLLPPALMPRRGVSAAWGQGFVQSYPCQLAVNANGDVALADVLLDSEPHLLGNCAGASLESMVPAAIARALAAEARQVLAPATCGQCRHAPICAGGNRPLAIRRGTPDAPDSLCQQAYLEGALSFGGKLTGAPCAS